MWKLQRNYFIAYRLQIVCKHNKNRVNEHLQDEMVEEECDLKEGTQCYRSYIHGAIENWKKERTQPIAIPLIYRLRKGIR